MDAVARIVRPAVFTLAAVALILVACASEGGVDEALSNDTTTDEVKDSATHDVGIAPCTPVDGSALDPCRLATHSLRHNPNAHRHFPPGYIPSDNPTSIRRFLGGWSAKRASHIVVRATYLPKTVRCVIYEDRRSDGWDREDIQCFIDIRANEYVLGSGPDVLTVSFGTYFPWTDVALETEDTRRNMERAYMRGGRVGPGTQDLEVIGGGLPGRESILFLGPATNYTIEAWEIFVEWDVQRRDGVVRAIHPAWAHYNRYGTDEQKAQTELTLPAFAAAVIAANNARKRVYNGRVGVEADAPMIIPSAHASDLHQHHIDSGNTAHPDGPPETNLPPPCGKAVPSQRRNPGLMLDCIALLEAKDELRGTGALNWSVDVAITRWDGVTVAGTPLRVTGLELANKSLTGSIPASLARLDLAVLRLSGNGLTGCIPVGLKDVPTYDLSALNLLYCSPPAPAAPTAGTVTETSVPLSWTAVDNTSKYRVEHKAADEHEWTIAKDDITTTSYTATVKCGPARQLRVSAFGSGTVYAAAWSEPSAAVVASTAVCVTPVFSEETYALTVSEDAVAESRVGLVFAADPNGDPVSYSITAGNEDGAFAFKPDTSTIIVTKALDYETTPSYTLTVEASDGTNTATAKVVVTVTDVAE